MKIPYRKQETDFYCGPASLQMAYAFFHKRVSQKELAKRLKIKRLSGTKNSELVRVAVEDGFSCFVKQHASAHDIRRQMKKGCIVIVNFIEPVHDYGHFAVVKRLTASKILLADPWNGDHFEMNMKDFLSRWHGSKNIYKRWILGLCLDKKERIGD